MIFNKLEGTEMSSKSGPRVSKLGGQGSYRPLVEKLPSFFFFFFIAFMAKT